MESALSRLVVLRQPGLTFAGHTMPFNVSPYPRSGSRAGGNHADADSVREACKASEAGT